MFHRCWPASHRILCFLQGRGCGEGVVVMKPAALALWALLEPPISSSLGSLLMVTLYLKHRSKPVWFTGIPAVFMMGSTIVSMGINLKRFLGGDRPDYLLGGVGLVLLFLGIWLVVAAVLALRSNRTTDDPLINLSD